MSFLTYSVRNQGVAIKVVLCDTVLKSFVCDLHTKGGGKEKGKKRREKAASPFVPSLLS